MKIKAISISDRKGVRKKNIESVNLVVNFGLENDAHGGKWHRQVSLLAQESIDKMRAKGLDVVAGNFAENITTEGINLDQLTVGEHLQLGDTEIIISQLGKVCHHKCAIYHQAGDCVMPREGIFGVVVKGGEIRVGDPISPLSQISTSAAIVANKSIEKDSGDDLQRSLRTVFSPSFIRFDRLNDEENNLPEILNDLVNLQRVDTIILVDPSGRHSLSFVGFRRAEGQSNKFIKEKTHIHYCRSVGEVSNL